MLPPYKASFRLLQPQCCHATAAAGHRLGRRLHTVERDQHCAGAARQHHAPPALPRSGRKDTAPSAAKVGLVGHSKLEVCHDLAPCKPAAVQRALRRCCRLGGTKHAAGARGDEQSVWQYGSTDAGEHVGRRAAAGKCASARSSAGRSPARGRGGGHSQVHKALRGGVYKDVHHLAVLGAPVGRRCGQEVWARGWACVYGWA